MIRFAITGPSGCGKGYVCELIMKKYGYPCLNTDNLVHDMYKKNTALIKELSLEFGEGIIKNGAVNRDVLRGIVFNDKEKLAKLNSIVHKAVADSCVKWFAECEEKGNKAAFIDAPQFFEANMQTKVDYVICIVASDDIRLQRIINRDGIDEKEAYLRMNNQAENENYIKKSDFAIINEGFNDIHSQLKDIFNEVGL